MKLANDFIEKCLDIKIHTDKIKEQLKKENQIYSSVWMRNETKKRLYESLFIVEEDDLIKAIDLCKEFKRSTQKKTYELKLKQFKETNSYSSVFDDGYNFINDLKNELVGNRRNYDKSILVNMILTEQFPEKNEIECGRELLRYCLQTNQLKLSYEQAQKDLFEHQSNINKIHDGFDGGATVVELVEIFRDDDD